MFLRALLKIQSCSVATQQARTYARGNHNSRLGVHQKRTDPGVRRQTKLLQDFEEYLEDPEGFGNYESDFMDVHKVHKEYEREVVYNAEKVQQLMIKNKYFKDNSPGFLTWSEKEQMRQLHSKNPEEWSLERLAESFPANIPTVVKVVKAKWVPRDANAVQKHDERVKRAWNMFRKNECKDLDPQLVEHLKKFSHRNFDNTVSSVVQKALEENKFKFPKPKKSEFASIITSCKGYKTDTPELSDGQKSVVVKDKALEITDGVRDKMPTNDTFALGVISRKNYMQFDQVKKVQKDPEVTTMNPFSDTYSDQVIELKMDARLDAVGKFEKDESTMENYQKHPSEIYLYDNLKERIKIPKKLYKKGATYQMKDCFYDSTGELLYRVPGLTGIKRT